MPLVTPHERPLNWKDNVTNLEVVPCFTSAE